MKKVRLLALSLVSLGLLAACTRTTSSTQPSSTQNSSYTSNSTSISDSTSLGSSTSFTSSTVVDSSLDSSESSSVDNSSVVESSIVEDSSVQSSIIDSSLEDSSQLSSEDTSSSQDSSIAFIDVTSITISNGKVSTLRVGEKVNFLAGVKPNNATDKSVIWHVSDKNVASISSTGELTALSVGSVTVYATSNSAASEVKSNEITIQVKEQPKVDNAILGKWKWSDYPEDTIIDISNNKVSVVFGNNNATASLDFADVDDDGYCLFGVFKDKNTPGYLKAKISHSYQDQLEIIYNIVDSANVTQKVNVYTQNESAIRYIKAESMSLRSSYTYLKLNQTTSISAVFGPRGASEEKWSLESDDTNIVAIKTSSGETNKTTMSLSDKTIIAKGEGDVTLRATSESGLTASIDINVAITKVSKITVTLENDHIEVGSATKASATVEPEDADDASFTWSSSNSQIATVDETGAVKAISAGECEIIATANDGSGVIGKATLYVSEKQTQNIYGKYTGKTPDNDIDFIFEIKKDNTATLEVDPDGYSGGESGSFTLSSQDDGVYTFVGSYTGEDAKVVFNGKNNTLSLLDSSDSPLLVYYQLETLENVVLVKQAEKKVTEIEVELKDDRIFVGDTTTAKAIITPKDAGDLSVTWSSSKESVATVDDKGVVTGIKSGSANIIATANDGSGVVGMATIYVQAKKNIAGSYSGETSYGSLSFTFTVAEDNTATLEVPDAEETGEFTLSSVDGNIYTFEGTYADVDCKVIFDTKNMTLTLMNEYDDVMIIFYGTDAIEDASVTKN
jgi:uncharacterized protein YjdB